MEIVVLATGGTFSAKTDDRLEGMNYEAGGFTIQQIIEQIPEIESIANLTLEQLDNINSEELNFSHWYLLKERIEFYLNNKGYDGVVITHGTDTLEETAYFLNLTINTDKPVVMVGSQRPFTYLSSDAPINLIQAVRVASSSDSVNKGVLVVLNNQINGARDATKTSTNMIETFNSRELGILGYVDVDGVVKFYRTPTEKHTINSDFSGKEIKEMPEVAIIYSYAGSSGDIIRFILKSKKYAGIVIAGTGSGRVSLQEEKALIEARKKGLIIVRSSRVGSGRVLPVKKYKELGFLNADNMTPQKTRIILMLSLEFRKNNNTIQRFLKEY